MHSPRLQIVIRDKRLVAPILKVDLGAERFLRWFLGNQGCACAARLGSSRQVLRWMDNRIGPKIAVRAANAIFRVFGGAPLYAPPGHYYSPIVQPGDIRKRPPNSECQWRVSIPALDDQVILSQLSQLESHLPAHPAVPWQGRVSPIPGIAGVFQLRGRLHLCGDDRRVETEANCRGRVRLFFRLRSRYR